MRAPSTRLTKSLAQCFAISLFVAATSAMAEAQSTPTEADAEQIPSELIGQWRGVLQIQDGVYLALGINVSDSGVTLDSPNQGMFEREPTEYSFTTESFSFVDQGLGARFEGQLEGGALVGTFHQAGSLPLELNRLNDEDRDRLEFEGTYQGELKVNAQTALPLRLNIAVLHAEHARGAYLATLDSPAQQSFGIPVSNLHIDAEHLSFESPMIRATYAGEGSDGTYEGVFTQGLPLDLTFEKVDADRPLAEVTKPQPGEYGAAKAILKGGGDGNIQVEHSFYQDHDEQTQYEIGSVSKTMVAYLLAKLADDGVVAEDARLNTWYEEADESLTLVSLATHHSGLPRLPDNLFEAADPQDPYAHFDEQHLRSALANTTLREPNYAYSNYGFGLLGEALGKAADMSFAELMDAELFAPLAMPSSYVSLTGHDAGAHAAQGHDLPGQEVGAWHFKALAGAGAVVADLQDMVAYTQAMMALAASDNGLATRLFSARYPLGECCEQALGWILQADPEGRMTAWHSGQTGGFSAFVGFYLDGSAGLVWLSAQGVDHSAEMLTALWEQAEE